jgi:hypothetical protein
MDLTLGKAYEALNFLSTNVIAVTWLRWARNFTATEVIHMFMRMRGRQGAQT